MSFDIDPQHGAGRASHDVGRGRIVGASKAPNTTVEALVRIVQETPWFVRVLDAADALALDDWCVGAGALRNCVWDALHGHTTPSPLRDIDVAYFDASDLSPERDRVLEDRLARLEPSMPWEVTNQAGVHRWFEDCFGHPVEPLSSLDEAVASWPETATSVAVSRRADGSIRVIAPHGLDDLFAMIVRRNPVRVSIETYRRRVADKRYADRWPRVRVVDG